MSIKEWSFYSKLSGSENHRGFRLADPNGVIVAEIFPLDQDGIQGRQIAEFVVRACNSHADLLAACMTASLALMADAQAEQAEGRVGIATKAYRAVEAAIAKAKTP